MQKYALRVSGPDHKVVTMLAVVAALMLVLMFLPASLWKHPANDLSINGFDSNLLYVNDPADVDISPSAISWAPRRDVIPAGTFLTTSLPSLQVSFRVTVTAINAAG